MRKLEFRHIILFVISLLTMICFFSELIPASKFWAASLFSYSTPFVLVILPITLLIYLIIDIKLSWVPLILMLLGAPYYRLTYGLPIQRDVVQNDKSLTLLSYNVKYFRMPNTYSKFSLEVIKWVTNHPSDIKCLQEFSTNSKWEVLDSEKLISDRGYNAFIYSADVPGSDHNLGMAIFTKYEIVYKGFVWTNERNSNGAIFADLLYQDDTIRIYNIHFTSMGLKLQSASIGELLRTLKSGAIKREARVKQLIEHVRSCPYPTLIVGDFNELPYGYNFGQLYNEFHYSFKEVGSGFGRTLNQPFLPIRIDHQFYNEGVSPVVLYADQRMNMSDHFPIIGKYIIK